MAKRRRKSKKPIVTRFRVGDNVRVKHGFTDVEYADLPMGGWAGTVTDVDKRGVYTVRWTPETLAAIHPVFKKRCERDGLVFEEYWFGDDDLEPDTGGPLDIEHPEEIVTRPLSPKDQDDRIRMVLGLTSDDPLSDVDDETLEQHHAHLRQQLSFPFDAEYTMEPGPFSARTIQVKVIGLGDPDDDRMIDDMYGILCEARHEQRVMILPLGDLEAKKGNPNRQLIADYAYWFWNWR